MLCYNYKFWMALLSPSIPSLSIFLATSPCVSSILQTVSIFLTFVERITSEREGVTIKKYDIIYQLLEDIEKTLLSLLEPEVKEVELGKAEVRQVFTIGKTNKIAGCYVTEGKIVRSKDAVLYRDGQEIFRGAIDQLKRFKDDVKEVAQGFECGISFSKFNDIQIGDIIEVSTKEEVERKSL